MKKKAYVKFVTLQFKQLESETKLFVPYELLLIMLHNNKLKESNESKSHIIDQP